MMTTEVGELPPTLRHGLQFQATNERGEAQAPLASAGSYEVRVWPKRLSSQEARNELQRKGQAVDRAAQVLLGTIVVRPGGRKPAWQELTVPGSAGY